MPTISANIKWTTDLNELRRELKSGQDQIVVFQAAAERTTRILGGEGLIRAAHNAAAAVQQLGGASGLTAKEQDKLNSLMGRTIEKMDALNKAAAAAGKQTMAIPSAFRQIYEETSRTEPLLGRLGSLITSTFGQFTAAGLAVSALQKLGGEFGNLMATAQKLPATEASFKRLADGIGQNAAQMLSGMHEATRGLVTDYDLMISANKAMLLGLPVTSKSMGELAKTATVLGKAMGQDAAQSLDDLIVGLGRMSPKILDNLGLIVKEGEANEAYALKLGKTANQLTDAEKKMAFYTAAMEAAHKKQTELGDQAMTLGEIFQRAWVGASDSATSALAAINVGVGRDIQAFGELLGGLRDLTIGHRELADAMRDVANATEQQDDLTVNYKDHTLQLIPVLGAYLDQKRQQARLEKEAEEARLAYNRAVAKAQENAPKVTPLGPVAPDTKLVEFNQTLDATSQNLSKLSKGYIEAILRGAELNKSTSEIAKGLGVEEAVVSSIIEAHKKAKTADDELAKALKAIADAQIPLTEAQQASVRAWDQQGISASTMAKALKVGEAAVSGYLERLKNANEIAKRWVDLHDDMAKATHKLNAEIIAAITKQQRDEADVSGKTLEKQFAAYKDYAEKNRQLVMSGTDLRLRQIELEKQATLTALGEQVGETSEVYRLMRAEVDKYYDHLKRVATATPDTLVERMRDMGVRTRAELDLIAKQAKDDYEDMKASGLYTYDELQAAAQRAKEAQAAAADDTRQAWIHAFGEIRRGTTAVASAFGVLANVSEGEFKRVVSHIQEAVEAIGNLAEGAAQIAEGDYIGGAANVLTGMVGLIDSIFDISPTEYEKRTKREAEESKKLLDDLVKAHGGMQQLLSDAHRVGIAIEHAFSWKDPEALKTLIADLDTRMQKMFAGIQTYAQGAQKRIEAFVKSFNVDDFKKLQEAIAGEAPEEFMGAAEAAARAALGKLGTVGGAPDQLRGEFARMGLYAGTAFAQTFREEGLAKALEVAGPMFDQLDELKKKFPDMGLSLEGAAAQFAAFYQTAKDNADVMGALDGLSQMIKGAGDAMFLDQELFNAFSTDAVAQFEKLTERGVASNQALVLMQPTLQALWEAQEKFGLVTDDATAALLRQAEEQGVVGENMRSVNEQMLDVLKEIAKVLGADIPAAADKAGKGVDSAFKGKHYTIPVDFDVENPPEPDFVPTQNAAAAGGIVGRGRILPFAAGGDVPHLSGGSFGRIVSFIPRGTDTVAAMLTPGEVVLTPTHQAALIQALRVGSSAQIALRAVVGGGGGVAQPVILECDRRELGRTVVPVLPGQARRLGVKVRA